ncbi:PspC domain-containing protein [Pseudonocardia spinosispora]|uniref:PspC domain-containing protein n=1 Tax=Pseudonocardia spinosispora TaxID=103441 RepID=UPI00048A5823|nr:PspC domain-containing protein [Pseudonocardia spinosispora]
MSPTTEPRAVLAAIWQTRPSRRQSDKKIAGVCGAIGRRYDIDPVLVRIGFVVAAIYGVGILLYLAAWVVLPADPNEPPSGPFANRASGSVHPIVMIAAIVAALFALSSLMRGGLGLIAGLVVTAGLLYLLHQNRADRGLPGTEPRPVATPDPEPGPAPVPSPSLLGADPFAPDLPGHGEPPPPPKRRRKPLTAIVFALAVLTGGVVASIILMAGGPGGPDAVRLVLGCVLAVIALGLLLGAFLHQGRGLILLAIPLVLIAFGVTKARINHWEQSGELRIAPTTVAGLAETYHRGFGTVELDLTQLDLSAPGTPPPPPVPPAPGQPAPTGAAPVPPPAPGVPPLPPVHTKISMQAGEVIVILPPNADVTVRCHTDVGSVDCLGQHDDGAPGADLRDADLGEDHTAGGRPLDIDITVGAGTVSVNRG